MTTTSPSISTTIRLVLGLCLAASSLAFSSVSSVPRSSLHTPYSSLAAQQGDDFTIDAWRNTEEGTNNEENFMADTSIDVDVFDEDTLAETPPPPEPEATAASADDGTFSSKVSQLFANAPKATQYDVMIKLTFPGALNYEQLESRIVKELGTKGYSSDNTLLATSLCCDELARGLEKDLVKVYGSNFNLGGLAGFPFAGNTGFGAMAAHIPDDGSVLIVYGPHVGVATDGGVGKVERRGIELLDNCCGSAIAASNYLKGITDGGGEINVAIQQFTDFQQRAVQELILPHGKRLSDAEDRMRELPFCLYESQDELMRTIVKTGAGGVKNKIALLGGIQINTAPEALDYFLPLRFDYMNNEGEVVEDMLEKIVYN